MDEIENGSLLSRFCRHLTLPYTCSPWPTFPYQPCQNIHSIGFSRFPDYSCCLVPLCSSPSYWYSVMQILNLERAPDNDPEPATRNLCCEILNLHLPTFLPVNSCTFNLSINPWTLPFWLVFPQVWKSASCLLFWLVLGLSLLRHTQPPCYPPVCPQAS